MSEQRQARIDRWIRPELLAQKAYPVPSSDGLIKLDAMENPYQWPEAMRRDWLETLRNVSLNRYPSATAASLRDRLKHYYGVPEGFDLLLGNGSDEIIQMLLMAVSGAGRTIMAPMPGFVMFRIIAESLRLNFRGVDLDQDFNLDMPAMLRAIEAEEPAVIFLAQPNNPTGNLWGAEQLRRIIEATSGLVVVDEAYTAFTDADYLSLLESYDNVLVMRTVSKIGLAGLRLGALIGHPDWLSELNKVRLPYNVNTLTQASAEFALLHADVLAEQTARIRTDRAWLSDELSTVPGVRVFPSEANFLLFRAPQGQARVWFESLRQAGILIKCVDGSHPLLADCLRVTVGTGEENAAFVSALRKIAGDGDR